MQLPKLFLASTSPRRRQILDSIGLKYELAFPSAEEIHPSTASLAEGVQLNARTKAISALENILESGAIVLGADTLVTLDGDVIGKPKDQKEATEILGKLQGNTHSVFSGVALVSKGRAPSSIFVESKVRFKKLSPEEIHAYVSTREPYDKAGAYAVQGLGALFIDQIQGSYTNVMGLPIEAFLMELEKFSGIPLQKWFL